MFKESLQWTIMQVVFLESEIVKPLLGSDFTKVEDKVTYIKNWPIFFLKGGED